MKRRVHRYGVPHSGGDARRWEIMTNWADDIIEEEADENEEVRSDGDVLGEVTGKVRRKAASVRQAIPFEEQWETDLEAFETCKVCQVLLHTTWRIAFCKLGSGEELRLIPQIAASVYLSWNMCRTVSVLGVKSLMIDP